VDFFGHVLAFYKLVEYWLMKAEGVLYLFFFFFYHFKFSLN
jgi:hypothetical protein